MKRRKKERKKTDCSSKAAFIDLQKVAILDVAIFYNFSQGCVFIERRPHGNTWQQRWLAGCRQSETKASPSFTKGTIYLYKRWTCPFYKSITTKVFYFPSPYRNSKAITWNPPFSYPAFQTRHHLKMVIFQPVLTQRDCFNAMKFRPERFHVVTKRRGYFKMAT